MSPADHPDQRPLRILIGTDTFAPIVNGAARFAERLAAGLVDRGHDVRVIAPSANKRDVGIFWETIEGRRMRVYRWPSIRWYPHEWLRFTWPWRAGPLSRPLLDDFRPDVVHIQSHIVVGRGIVPEARLRGIRVVATNHIMPENILDHTSLPGPVNDAFFRWAWNDIDKTLSLADAVTTPTRRAADFLEKNTSLRGVIPVSCGIDAGHYRPDLEPRTEDRLIFVGRLTSEKQVEVILRALARLDRPVPLDIVGDGDQRKGLEALCRELGLADRVVFHGKVDDARLVELYSRAAVFAIASIAELQSIATLEAMASGLPVVAADAMALPHLVEDGENGYLFPPGDDEALADRLDRVLSQDRETRVAMQRASLEGVVPHDIERTLDTFEALYRGRPLPA